MLFLTLLLAHTLSFGKSLKTEQYIQCLERATSPPHSFNALPVPNALSYSLCKLVLCLLASQETRHRINSRKGTLEDSLKRCNRSGRWHKQLLLPQPAYLHPWPSSYRIGKVSWKSLFCYVPFIWTAQLSRGHKRRNNPISKLKSSLTQRCNRMRRAWKENEGKTTTPQNWRGQRWGATQRALLLSTPSEWNG